MTKPAYSMTVGGNRKLYARFDYGNIINPFYTGRLLYVGRVHLSV